MPSTQRLGEQEGVSCLGAWTDKLGSPGRERKTGGPRDLNQEGLHVRRHRAMRSHAHLQTPGAPRLTRTHGLHGAQPGALAPGTQLRASHGTWGRKGW